MEIHLSENNYGEKRFFARGEDDEFICKCGKILTEGYICECTWLNVDNEERHDVFCLECQEKCKMTRLPCVHDRNGQHEHIKFIRSKGNATEQTQVAKEV